MKKLLLFIFISISPTVAVCQQIIRGQIFTAYELGPLVGATIKVNGLNAFTATDSTGRFSLNIKSFPAVLQISFVGFQTQVLTLNAFPINPITIKMIKQSSALQEVVVSTGYQTLSKERATGSFTKVDNATFNQQVSTNVLSRLEAITSGLTFDRSTTSTGQINIRGLSTIQGPKDVLVVVDNFPYNGDLNNINPNDVESITILKDAAAASIWGTRAGNGVIVITTKKGRFNQPLTVDFNSNVLIGDKPDLSKIRQMSSSDFIDVEQFLYSKGYYTSKINSTSKPALTPVIELLVKKAAGTISAADADVQINALRGLDVRNDYNKYFYRHLVNQQYSLGLKGGVENYNWLFASGYDKNISNLNAGLNRINLRFQQTYKPVKRLEITTSLFFTQSKTTTGKPGYGEITSLSGVLFPYAQFADANGNALPVIKDYRQSYLQTAGGGKLLDWNYYPLTDYQHNTTTSTNQDITGNAGVQYEILPGLKADIKYQYERQQTTGRNLMHDQSYTARNLVNTYTQISTAGVATYKIPKGGILDQSQGIIESNNVRGQLSYDKDWGVNSLAVIAGAEIRNAHTTANNYRLYGYDDNILTFGNVDYTTSYPTFITGRTALIPNNASLTDELNRFVSEFANAAYTYQGKYTLSASARRDASNLFGVNSNDRWKPLWSTGLSWDIAKEKFYHRDFLPYLRFRATYGFSGNVDQSKSAVTTIRFASTSPYTQIPISQFVNYANPDLRWETAGITNLGIDFALENNRLSGSIEYYHKKGTDLFGLALQDYTSGTDGTMVKNAASMSGSGMDIVLNSINIKTQNFTWNSNFNFSFYQDKITQYYLPDLSAYNFLYYNPSVSGVVGKPVYGIYSYKSAGLDPTTGDPQGYVNGAISKNYSELTGTNTTINDLKYFGSALPIYFGSFGNTFSYKNVTLTARITYKLGYYFRKSGLAYADLFARGQGNSDLALRWQKPGDEKMTTVPSLTYPANSNRDAFYDYSETLVEKGDHIRFQYISAAYTFDKSKLGALPFKSVQFYLNINNLGIIWRANKSGLDPDYIYSINAPPPAKTYAFGIRATL